MSSLIGDDVQDKVQAGRCSCSEFGIAWRIAVEGEIVVVGIVVVECIVAVGTAVAECIVVVGEIEAARHLNSGFVGTVFAVVGQNCCSFVGLLAAAAKHHR